MTLARIARTAALTLFVGAGLYGMTAAPAGADPNAPSPGVACQTTFGGVTDVKAGTPIPVTLSCQGFTEFAGQSGLVVNAQPFSDTAAGMQVSIIFDNPTTTIDSSGSFTTTQTFASPPSWCRSTRCNGDTSAWQMVSDAGDAAEVDVSLASGGFLGWAYAPTSGPGWTIDGRVSPLNSGVMTYSAASSTGGGASTPADAIAGAFDLTHAQLVGYVTTGIGVLAVVVLLGLGALVLVRYTRRAAEAA